MLETPFENWVPGKAVCWTKWGPNRCGIHTVLITSYILKIHTCNTALASPTMMSQFISETECWQSLNLVKKIPCGQSQEKVTHGGNRRCPTFHLYRDKNVYGGTNCEQIDTEGKLVAWQKVVIGSATLFQQTSISSVAKEYRQSDLLTLSSYPRQVLWRVECPSNPWSTCLTCLVTGRH